MDEIHIYDDVRRERAEALVEKIRSRQGQADTYDQEIQIATLEVLTAIHEQVSAIEIGRASCRERV